MIDGKILSNRNGIKFGLAFFGKTGHIWLWKIAKFLILTSNLSITLHFDSAKRWVFWFWLVELWTDFLVLIAWKDPPNNRTLWQIKIKTYWLRQLSSFVLYFRKVFIKSFIIHQFLLSKIFLHLGRKLCPSVIGQMADGQTDFEAEIVI